MQYGVVGNKPALVSFAMRIASSSVLKRKRGATGPNTSFLVKTDLNTMY